MSIKDYFAFTRGEKRGALVLLVIIVLLISAHFFIDLFIIKEKTDFSELKKAIAEFEQNLNKKESTEPNLHNINYFEFNPNTISNEEWRQLGFKDWQIKSINNYKSKGGQWKTRQDVAKIYGLTSEKYEQLKPYILLPENPAKPVKEVKENKNPIYFEFDPNTISQEDWRELGFKEWQVRSIFNYKAKGGKWETKSDVKKIYRLSEEDYIKLKPYILLPEETTNTATTEKIDLNKANVKDLMKLPEIHSEKYATTIINYRNKLGGFINKQQLREVWGMKENTYNKLVLQIELTVNPDQLNINKLDAKALKVHPYIDWNTANAIVKYRKMHGNYSSVEDLKKIALISNENYTKIAPYLKTEENAK